MKTQIQAEIDRLEARIAELNTQLHTGWEWRAPEQDAVARENRDAINQSIAGAAQQLAYYRKRLTEV